MAVNIAQRLLDNDALGGQLAVEARVVGGVERHEIVGHDAAAAIDRAVLLQRLELQRVGKVDAVLAGQLAVLQAVHHVHGVAALVALLIGLLDAAPRGGEVVGNGEPDHRAVGQVDGALHQSLAKGAAAHHLSSILVLDGACDNLGRRGRIFVDQHHHAALGEAAVGPGAIVAARHAAALGINDEVALVQQLAGHVGRCLQIAAAVALEVQHQVGHALVAQPLKALHKLMIGGG